MAIRSGHLVHYPKMAAVKPYLMGRFDSLGPLDIIRQTVGPDAAEVPLARSGIVRLPSIMLQDGCICRRKKSLLAEIYLPVQCPCLRALVSATWFLFRDVPAGTPLDNVMTNTCYVTKSEDLPGFNEIYANYFNQDWPARTTIIVNFGDPNNLVEITSTACLPE